jgi:hypothetical protein
MMFFICDSKNKNKKNKEDNTNTKTNAPKMKVRRIDVMEPRPKEEMRRHAEFIRNKEETQEPEPNYQEESTRRPSL